MRQVAWAVGLALMAGTVRAASAFDAASVKRGEYLARAGDCIACHARPGGSQMSGGLGLPTPVGTLYATNITPDRETGIGRYSFREFAAAVREGVRKDGATLYPAMPYPSYSIISDEDMRDLYAYFMAGVRPVRQVNRAADIPWPLSLRWPLALWRRLFAPQVAAYRPDPARDAIWNRGAYLVKGPGHCGACHTPRGVAFQEKALDERDGPAFLAGATIGGWFAKSLRREGADGLGRWSEKEIAELLGTGRNSHSVAFGAMAEVVAHSTRHLSEGDLGAIARYLASVSGGTAARELATRSTTFQDLAAGRYSGAGAVIYMERCVVCHRQDGEGVEHLFPALARSSVVNSPDPASLIRIVLEGSRLPPVRHEAFVPAMPSLAALSDREVADVMSFVRASWGNTAPEVTERDVGKVRRLLSAEVDSLNAAR
ncbi:cytochrome c [Paludibacterium paludis]|uniref:Cytochrome c n=1 Tax=Paludibacterium paludis TaxID=1225769 RepID=A0A918UAG5_9NEIS|nr:cytochrome c [Paludibacterium paludis]GGY21696.1 cytochrome c [Paludibacterium paludis]